MKKNTIVIGGSSGLGLAIIREIDKLALSNPVCISRSNNNLKEKIGKHIDHIALNLSKTTSDEIKDVINKLKPIDKIIFSQRFRPDNNMKDKERDASTEFRINVEATALFMEELINYLNTNTKDQGFIKIAIVGSTYAERAGYDQDWSYHASKTAQQGLVRYYSIKSKGLYNINSFSPPTFVKKGAEQYWEKNTKSNIWEKYPAQELLTADKLAKEIIGILETLSKWTSGNNIIIDSGVSYLYHDQQ